MNGKKKKLVVLGCYVLMAATIAGCSVQGSKSEKNQSASDKADSDSKSKGTVECVSEIEDRDFEQDEEVTIKKQVLVDQDGVVITAEEYICNQEDGEGILLSVANNTDKSIDVSLGTVFVNDYLIDSRFTEDVAAGETEYIKMIMDEYDLEQASIEAIGQIESNFVIYDTETCDEKLESDLIKIKTSAYAEMDNEPMSDGVELYNEHGVRIVGMSVNEEGAFGTDLVLCMENSTKKDMILHVREVSANGIESDGVFIGYAPAGKKSLNTYCFSTTDMEKNGIDKIEEIEMKFSIEDKETTERIESEIIKFNVE